MNYKFVVWLFHGGIWSPEGEPMPEHRAFEKMNRILDNDKSLTLKEGENICVLPLGKEPEGARFALWVSVNDAHINKPGASRKVNAMDRYTLLSHHGTLEEAEAAQSSYIRWLLDE